MASYTVYLPDFKAVVIHGEILIRCQVTGQAIVYSANPPEAKNIVAVIPISMLVVKNNT